MIVTATACQTELVQLNVSSIIKIIGTIKGGVNMNTTAEKIKHLQKLLEERYPVEVYDISEKNSIFRLRADKIINKIYQLEEEK